MKDMKGYSFTVGCKVARPTMFGKSPIITICTVTKIEGGKMYLDNSKQHIRIPGRLLIIEHDPLIKLVQDHQMEQV